MSGGWGSSSATCPRWPRQVTWASVPSLLEGMVDSASPSPFLSWLSLRGRGHRRSSPREQQKRQSQSCHSLTARSFTYNFFSATLRGPSCSDRGTLRAKSSDCTFPCTPDPYFQLLARRLCLGCTRSSSNLAHPRLNSDRLPNTKKNFLHPGSRSMVTHPSSCSDYKLLLFLFSPTSYLIQWQIIWLHLQNRSRTPLFLTAILVPHYPGPIVSPGLLCEL